jgi:hypothetical protein
LTSGHGISLFFLALSCRSRIIRRLKIVPVRDFWDAKGVARMV